MTYIPSDEDLNQYEVKQPSLGRKVWDYESGLIGQLANSGAKGGYNIAHFLGNLPSKAYESISGQPLYEDFVPKPDLEGFLPKSESGQTGRHVGETVADLASLFIPGSVANKGIRALSKIHPFTKNQMGKRFEKPIQAAEEAGIRAELPNNQLYELNDLLSHPALEKGGSTGRSLTPIGRQALIQGAAEGRVPSLHSAQSLLGDLERAIPKHGESILATNRVRPLKDLILEMIQQGMIKGEIPEAAEEYQQARQGARRYYKTKEIKNKIGKKIGKPLSLAAMIRGLIFGAQELP